MHKSVNYYEVNPYVTTTQVKKRNTASTGVLLPFPTKEYRHPDFLIFASFFFKIF